MGWGVFSSAGQCACVVLGSDCCRLGDRSSLTAGLVMSFNRQAVGRQAGCRQTGRLQADRQAVDSCFKQSRLTV
jgi:hypothetical protein